MSVNRTLMEGTGDLGACSASSCPRRAMPMAALKARMVPSATPSLRGTVTGCGQLWKERVGVIAAGQPQIWVRREKRKWPERWPGLVRCDSRPGRRHSALEAVDNLARFVHLTGLVVKNAEGGIATGPFA